MSGAGEAGPVAILAGSGELPRLIAERLAREGRQHRVLAFRGFADRATSRRADATVDLLDVHGAMACLKRWAPGAVTLAGGVQRPMASAALGAFSAFRNRDEIARLMARGDDNLLRGVVDLLEQHGHRLLGVRDLAPNLLASEGALGRLPPAPDDAETIAAGLALIASLAPHDIGQAVALEGRRVLAVEGPEGTDAMLARVGGLRRRPFVRVRAGRALLVKAPKPGQDLRVDLPAIGPKTVRLAARAGLSGIAVAAGLTLIIDRTRTIAEADRLGLFIMGASGAPT